MGTVGGQDRRDIECNVSGLRRHTVDEWLPALGVGALAGKNADHEQIPVLVRMHELELGGGGNTVDRVLRGSGEVHLQSVVLVALDRDVRDSRRHNGGQVDRRLGGPHAAGLECAVKVGPVIGALLAVVGPANNRRGGLGGSGICGKKLLDLGLQSEQFAFDLAAQSEAGKIFQGPSPSKDGTTLDASEQAPRGVPSVISPEVSRGSPRAWQPS